MTSPRPTGAATATARPLRLVLLLCAHAGAA
eukprot:CAMPEP_0194269828 /NCGR_PEP_ID=MMETSP0169-20130528/3947_1 /TAXON_ID=218684 /ORGANISM="Corethron pennatum, Strain L29A3" /LENGTH=30 /DNA_ID= /DNA_START= /DNA_END= /DNA_ORIENTATION=